MTILYIESCNYIDFPIGGQLTFARQAIKAFGNNLALVGIATDEIPIRQWIKKNIDGIVFDYFATHRVKIKPGKPFIPRRLTSWFYLKLSKKKILSIEFNYCICRAPEVMLAIHKWNILNLCYYFPGMSNPLELSRRWYGRLMKNIWEGIFYPTLKTANTILAAADKKSIDLTLKKAKKFATDISITQFTTRIDTDVFHVHHNNNYRKELNISEKEITVITTGRLHWAKNQKFLIDAFGIFHKKFPKSRFIIIGDGNLINDLKDYISQKYLNDYVDLVGFKAPEEIAKYLNIADIFIMGSIMEGWATSLVEAKACGVPICTTNFSSAKEIVTKDVGQVIEIRDSIIFAEQMEVLLLNNLTLRKNPPDVSSYSVSKLRDDLTSILKIAAK